MTQSFTLPRSFRIGFGSLAALALVMATVAPILASLGHVEAVALYLALDPFCHQLAERSWSFGGISAGLCIRCYGVYTGIAAAALLGLPFTKRVALGGVTALAAVWAVEHFGAAAVPEAARFARGGALGLALASVTTKRGAARLETLPGEAASND